MRHLTINPLQALFVMNSGFVQRAGDDAGRSRWKAKPTPEDEVQALYRKVFARDATRRRTGARRASISARRRHRALCAGAALHQRGDLLAMINSRAAKRSSACAAGSACSASPICWRATRLRAAAHTVGPALRAQGQARHPAVHDGRAVAGGSVGSEAGADEVRRPAPGDGRPAHRAHDRRAAAEHVQVLRSTARAASR